MRALILAAGWATRMGELAAGQPKHLLPIGRRTPLDFVVDALDAVPIVERIDVLTHEGFRADFEAWRAARGAGAPRIWGNETSRFEERRGAVADLHFFLERAEVDDDLLVLGGDQVFDFDLRPFAAIARREPAILLYDVGSTALVRRYASVEIDAAGTIVRLVEKDPEPRSTLAAPAIYGLPAAALGEVAAYLAAGGAPDNLGWLAEWLVRRRPVRGPVARGRWLFRPLHKGERPPFTRQVGNRPAG